MGSKAATTAAGPLVVKLPEVRVDQLVGAGRASLRARWQTVPRMGVDPTRAARTWRHVLVEALELVEAQPQHAPILCEACRDGDGRRV